MSESYSVNIGVTASGVEQAISQLKQLEDCLNRVNGMTAHVNVSMGNEDVINKIKDVEDAINKVNGTTANANVEMNSNAIDQINDVNDALNQVNGTVANINVEVESQAQNQLADIQDQVAMLDGQVAFIDVEYQSVDSPNIDNISSGGGGFSSGGGSMPGGSSNFDTGDMASFSNVFLHGAGRFAGRAAALMGGVGIGRSFNDYAKWEYQQAELEGVLDKSERTDEILSKLHSDSFNYANRGYSAYEISQSQTELAKAGFTANEIGNSLNGMINIANAGGLDIETSTGITSAVLRSFQLDTTKTDHVADVLAKTANATSSEIDGLGYSLKYCGSLSNTLGISLESTNASLGILSNYGIKGSQAGTTLRSAMNRLIAPTDKALETMDKFGLNFKDNNGNFKDFAGIIGELNRGLGDLSSSDKTKAINQIFGQIPMAGILSLMTAGEDEIRKLTETLETCDGAAQEMADIKMDTLMGQWMRFKAEVSNTATEFAKSLSPFAKDFLASLNDKMPDIRKKLVGFGDWLSENSDKVKDIAKHVGNVGLALGGLSLGNKVFGGMEKIAGLVGKLSSLGGLASTLNPVAVAIGGIAGSVAYLSATSETFRGDLVDKFSGLGDSFSGLKDSFSELNESLDGIFDKFGKFTLNGIGAGFIGFIDSLKVGVETISSLFDGLRKQFGAMGDIFGGYKKFYTGDFKEGISEIAKGYKDFASAGIDNAKELWSLPGKLQENTITKPFKNAYNNTYTAEGESAFNEKDKTVNVTYQSKGKDNVVQDAYEVDTNLRKIPSSVISNVDVTGGETAAQKIEPASNAIKSMPDEKKTNIDVAGGENAEQKIEPFKQAVNSIPENKNVSININNNAEQLGQMASSAVQSIPSMKDIVLNIVGADTVINSANNVNSAVIAIPSSHNTNITVTGASEAISAASSVAAAISSIPSSKTVTVSVQQVGSTDVQQNAMGTSFFDGGATTVAENGYEVVSFGKGTQIFSHGDSKEILNDYYKNQAALAKESSKNRGYQVSNGSNDGKVINLSFNISGGNTNDIVNKVAMQLTQVLENQA